MNPSDVWVWEAGAYADPYGWALWRPAPAGPDLLPNGATPLERDLAAASSHLDDIDPSIIEKIWDAWACPAVVLPWLGWALSVDHWDDGWDGVRKRQEIAASPELHRRKGTRAAVDSGLGLQALPIELIEWHETIPPGRRGTAAAFVELTGLGGIAALPGVARQLRRHIADAKPKSRAVACMVGERSSGATSAGVGICLRRTLRVSALVAEQPPVSGEVFIALGIALARQISIRFGDTP